MFGSKTEDFQTWLEDLVESLANDEVSLKFFLNAAVSTLNTAFFIIEDVGIESQKDKYIKFLENITSKLKANIVWRK